MVLAVVERGPPTRPFQIAALRGAQHGAVPTRTLSGTQDATTHGLQCGRPALWIVSPDNL